jgi:hypothetical protein
MFEFKQLNIITAGINLYTIKLTIAPSKCSAMTDNTLSLRDSHQAVSEYVDSALGVVFHALYHHPDILCMKDFSNIFAGAVLSDAPVTVDAAETRAYH